MLKNNLVLWILGALFLGAGATFPFQRLGKVDNSAISTELQRVIKTAQAVEHDIYTRDTQNIVSGRIIDSAGNALAGAKVRVFRELPDAGMADGKELEIELTTDQLGEFRFEGISYGCKQVIGSMPGYPSAVLDTVAVFDGYGARNLELQLDREVKRTIQVQSSSGSGPKPSSVKLTKSLGGIEELDVAITPEGEFTVPIEWCTSGHLPVASFGEPPFVVGLESCLESGVVTIPGVADLHLDILGMDASEEFRLTIYEESGQQIVTDQVMVEDGRVFVKDLPIGEYWVLGLASSRGFAAGVSHSGDQPHSVNTQPFISPVIDLQCAGAPHECTVSWSPFEIGTIEVQPVSFDPTLEVEVPKVLALGSLRVSAPNHISQSLNLEESNAVPARKLTANLEHSRRASIRVNRPYLPIVIKEPGSNPDTFFTDRFGEILIWAPNKRLVVESHYSLGELSLPKGVWIAEEGGTATVEFTVLDKGNWKSGAVYGFVGNGRGGPSVDAEVFIQGAGSPRKRTTDEHGFFRFAEIPPARYMLSARIKDADYSAVAKQVVLVQEPGDRIRQDLTLYDGAIALTGLPEGEVHSIVLRTSDEKIYWTADVDSEAVTIKNIRPDSYFLERSWGGTAPTVVSSDGISVELIK